MEFETGYIYAADAPPDHIHGVELHARVIHDAIERFDQAESDGSLDFMSECQAALALEDSPEKARALARVAGAALWYANTLRMEED
jgi:hypothetical protein